MCFENLLHPKDWTWHFLYANDCESPPTFACPLAVGAKWLLVLGFVYFPMGTWDCRCLLVGCHPQDTHNLSRPVPIWTPEYRLEKVRIFFLMLALFHILMVNLNNIQDQVLETAFLCIPPPKKPWESHIAILDSQIHWFPLSRMSHLLRVRNVRGFFFFLLSDLSQMTNEMYSFIRKYYYLLENIVIFKKYFIRRKKLYAEPNHGQVMDHMITVHIPEPVTSFFFLSWEA